MQKSLSNSISGSRIPSSRHRVHISGEAKQHALEVVERLVEQAGARVAERWLASFEATCHSLESFPLRCPLAAEAEDLKTDLRELWFGRRRGQYRVVFILDGQVVHVLLVRHKARDAITADDLPGVTT